MNGLSLAVVRDYRLVWAGGIGCADVEEKRPVTPETRFQAASISKSVNALGVLRLVEEGKIDLNQDINTYLKSWKFPYDEAAYPNKTITVAHVLSHTAGLTVHGFPGLPLHHQTPAQPHRYTRGAPAGCE